MDASTVVGPAIGAAIALVGIIINNRLTERRERKARLWDLRRIAYSKMLNCISELHDLQGRMLDYAAEDETRAHNEPNYQQLAARELEVTGELNRIYAESVLITSNQFKSAYKRYNEQMASCDTDDQLREQLLCVVNATGAGLAELMLISSEDLDIGPI